MSKRMIAPCIWESEQVTSLTMRQRLLWIGLFSTADDQGRGKALAGLVRARVFPLDDISLGDIDDDMQAIANTGLIILYSDGERNLYQVKKWWEYQTPQWARPSDFAPPDDWVDRIRCRMNNEYIEINWKAEGPEEEKDSSGEQAASCSGEQASEQLALSDRDRDSIKPTNVPQKRQSTRKRSTNTGESRAMFSALASLCQISLKTLTEKQRGVLNQNESELRKAGVCPADVDAFGLWWYEYDWRGRGDEKAGRPSAPPQPHQVREEWGKFEAWRNGNKTTQPNIIRLSQ